MDRGARSHCWLQTDPALPPAAFGKKGTGHLWLWKGSSEDSHISRESFSLTQRAASSFLSKILSICRIQQCTLGAQFFSNSRESAAAAAQPSWSSRQCACMGPRALCPLPSSFWPRVSAQPQPKHGCTFFSPPVKPVIISREFDRLLCQKGKNLLFHSCIE